MEAIGDGSYDVFIGVIPPFHAENQHVNRQEVMSLLDWPRWVNPNEIPGNGIDDDAQRPMVRMLLQTSGVRLLYMRLAPFFGGCLFCIEQSKLPVHSPSLLREWGRNVTY